MSLRRSPRRTPAFLAANRANARKSTGPRTAPGKRASAANGFHPRTVLDFRKVSLLYPDLSEYLHGRPIPPETLLCDDLTEMQWAARAEMVRQMRRFRERLLRRREARRNGEVKI